MSSKNIIVKIGQNICKISISDILFVSTNPNHDHSVILETTNDSLPTYGIISQYEEFKNLFRCHKSFVVNLNNIGTIDKSSRTITFKNSSKHCQISRRLMKPIMDTWLGM
ncbi:MULTISPECIES: LytTR family DNA-binding domain-containing protein [Latilactobacillus]|uniref:HTH LytTR-type domain-containing protein n=1 Tax=Latilactobacillus curvatus TaxID=28038 RepID=A0ABN6GQ71_LATCU|nr:LytTR family transcriptional regulator [Latilactobacillus sakei]KGB13857.1 hypothetical protein KY41_10855 [Latilactobacillus sakei]UTB73235.1 hypothetical protein A4W72_10775 [Latilactobacillus curvatus]BCX31504.1 hypothetical protein LTWDN19_20710 [Latilactobacillus curvatus]